MRELDWWWLQFLAWHKTWNFTTFLAAWGAVISTGTALWTIRKDLRDKPDIRVRASLRCIGFRDGDHAPYMANPSINIEGLDDKLYIVMSVTNVGRRKMRWKGWGGKYREQVNGKDGFLVSALHLPHTLDEQEHLDEWTLLDQHFVDGKVKRLYIWDVADRTWYVSRRNMRKLQADIEKFAEIPASI